MIKMTIVEISVTSSDFVGSHLEMLKFLVHQHHNSAIAVSHQAMAVTIIPDNKAGKDSVNKTFQQL
jgi:hypothetical protein